LGKKCKVFLYEGEVTMENRFRASIYVDVWVESTGNPDLDRDIAEVQVKEFQEKIPNSYIGGVARYRPTETESLDGKI